MKPQNKPATKRRGDFGEDLAVKFLKHKGYRILERNLHLSHYEVDIIAENRTCLVFAEVKTRTVPYLLKDGESPYAITPAMAVNKEKKRNLIAAARIYLASHPIEKQIRFDVFEVYLKENGEKLEPLKIRHIEDAFWVS